MRGIFRSFFLGGVHHVDPRLDPDCHDSRDHRVRFTVYGGRCCVYKEGRRVVGMDYYYRSDSMLLMPAFFFFFVIVCAVAAWSAMPTSMPPVIKHVIVMNPRSNECC